jgi:DNA polymerase-3 subunit alpha
MNARRAQLLEILERAVEMGQQIQNDKRSGQMAMFGAPPEATATGLASSRNTDVALPNVPELAGADLLKFEKELLGFYITSHPLTEHQATIERYTTASTREAMNYPEGTEVLIGGMLYDVKPKVAKTGRSAGQRWAILGLEDLEGKIEGMCYAETHADVSNKFPGVLAKERVVFMRGRVDRKRETPCLIVNDVIPIESSIERLTTSIGVKLDRARHSPDVVAGLRSTIQKHLGKKEIYVQVQTADGTKVSLKVNGELGVRLTKNLVDDLEMLLGNGSVQLGGDGQRRMKRIAQQQLFKEDTMTESVSEAPPADLEEMETVVEVE